MFLVGEGSHVVRSIFHFRRDTIKCTVPHRQGTVASVIYLIFCFKWGSVNPVRNPSNFPTFLTKHQNFAPNFALGNLSATRRPCRCFRLQFHVGELGSLSRKSCSYPGIGFTHLSYLLSWLHVRLFRRTWNFLPRKDSALCAPSPLVLTNPTPPFPLPSIPTFDVIYAWSKQRNIYRPF